jgi:hypothetical protein
MASNVVLIAAQEAEEAARNASDTSLEGRLRAAMSCTVNHWLATNEDDQFMAACEGTARVVDDEERERIENSLRLLQGLSAAASGMPVDFKALLPEDGEERLGIGLQPLWREIKDKP